MAAFGPISALGGVGGIGGGIGGAGGIAPAGGAGSPGSALAADPFASGGLGVGLDPAGATGVAGAASPPGAAATDPAQGFLDTLGKAFGQLNDQLVSADASLADFAAGGSSDLHTVLLQMQEASLGLQLGVQVRDRLLEAYTEIMRLQL
jgi:flagellar hook-basal body complex protein FliE